MSARYKVDWVPTFGITLAAKESGMPEGGNPLDYCRPEEANLFVDADAFDKAVNIAREKLPSDFLKRVRITDRDTEAVWYVTDTSVTPDLIQTPIRS